MSKHPPDANVERPWALALSRLSLLQGIDPELLSILEQQMEWFNLLGGATLFREGDPADALYAVTHGRLAVLRRDDEGNDIVLAEIGPGETVGEMAMVTGEPRSATVVALRDTTLGRLAKPAFEALLERHPRAMLSLTRLMVTRLRRTNVGHWPPWPDRCAALVPANEGVDVRAFADQLAAALGRLGREVSVLDHGCIGNTNDWFHSVEEAHDFTLYVADGGGAAWARQCLRQADRVLAVAEAAVAPGRAAELIRQEPGGRRRPLDLVLLHRQPGHAAVGAWLDRLEPGMHCHVRAGNQTDVDRMARLMTGKAVGLVLSGGGARGFAHIGALTALRQAGVPIDLVAGTSMGAVIGAGIAAEWDDKEMRSRMRAAFVDSNPLGDYTLPLIALVRGKRVTDRLRQHFPGLEIEQLWRHFTCVSTNLTKGDLELHRRGPVWRALRASVALPGVMPPVVQRGEVLADGGIINNFPVEAISALGRGPIIGIDVAHDRAFVADDEDWERPSLWRLFARGRQNRPGILRLLMRAGTVSGLGQARAGHRAVDLLLTPALEDIDMLDWKAFDRAVEAGYRATYTALEKADHLGFGGGE